MMILFPTRPGVAPSLWGPTRAVLPAPADNCEAGWRTHSARLAFFSMQRQSPPA